MKYLLVVLILGAGLVAITLNRTSSHAADDTSANKAQGLAEQIAKLQGEVKSLQDMSVDQAAVMSHLAYHWSNLWAALEQENWPLADFYLSETRSNLKWAIRVRPIRKVGNMEVKLKDIGDALDGTQFQQMKEAIGKKDKERCVKLYTDALQGCYACHKASDKPYLRPRIPTASEVRVINFDPNAKEPQ
jgi:hypothetical protein